MIYLSCIELDLEEREMRRWLSRPYQIHQRLLTAWPASSAGRVLYRAEIDRRPPRLLVQSPVPGDWHRCFQDLAGVIGPPQQKAVELKLRRGQALRFFLRANPTVRRLSFRQEDRVPGQRLVGDRVGLMREEEQVGWLRRKGEASGFDLLAVETRDRGDQVSFKPATRQRIVHRCVDFEGLLRVSDPERLQAAVREGIGSAKAFGFGLLSLARAG